MVLVGWLVWSIWLWICWKDVCGVLVLYHKWCLFCVVILHGMFVSHNYVVWHGWALLPVINFHRRGVRVVKHCCGWLTAWWMYSRDHIDYSKTWSRHCICMCLAQNVLKFNMSNKRVISEHLNFFFIGQWVWGGGGGGVKCDWFLYAPKRSFHTHTHTHTHTNTNIHTRYRYVCAHIHNINQCWLSKFDQYA